MWGDLEEELKEGLVSATKNGLAIREIDTPSEAIRE